MKDVRLSAKSLTDIKAVSDFIARDDPARASLFIDALRQRISSLALHPMQGRPAPEIATDVRLLVFRSYVILHRVLPDHVAIDRVLHRARDRAALTTDE